MSVPAKIVSGRGPGVFVYNAETKTFSTVASGAYWPGTTVLGLHTRGRLANARGDFGRWERTDQLNGFYVKRQLAQALPPECVAPGQRKMRSHRKDLSIYTIVEAADYDREAVWKLDVEKLSKLMDMPTEEIETIANMRRLARLGPRGA